MANNVSQSTGATPEDEIDLRVVWNLLVRNRLLIGGCVAIVVALAALYSYLSAPVYEASASIRIDEEKPALGIFGTLDMLAGGSEVSTEMEVLRSRTVAEAVVEQLGLQLSLRSPTRVPRNAIFANVIVDRRAPEAEYRIRATPDGRHSVENLTTGATLGTFSPGEAIALDGASVVLSRAAADWGEIDFEIVSFADAVENLQKKLSVSRPNREANVVFVRYESRDSILVYRVPNAVARTFIDARQEIQKTEARSTVEFLRGQIDAITAQLATAEDALQAFRENEQVVSLEAQATTQVTRLADLQAERNALETERAALASLLDEVESAATGASPSTPSPYRRLVAFPSLFRNQATSELLRSLTALENERAQLLNRRTAAHPDVAVLSERIRELEQQLRTIATTYLQGITSQVASLDAMLGRYGEQLERIPAKEIQFARLQRQAKVLEEIYLLLQTKLKEAEIAQAVEDPSVRLIDPAVVPIKPIKPRLVFNILLAMVLGTMLGTGAAFAREFMDTTIHTREDVQEITGVPVLGNIPRIRETGPSTNGRRKVSAAPAVSVNGTRTAGFEMRLVTGRDPRNPVSEAYRALRTNITFARPDEPPKAIVFTSPTPGDGKSTSAANLAVTLAQQGHKVLLVDADMRRGVLNNVFGEDREPGLSNVLLGTTDVARAIRSVDLGESGTLDFLPTGTLPPNPAELLGSTRMRDLLRRLEGTYDTIILDAPPLNLVTDAAVLGTNADGVLIVARAATTQKGALHYAMEQLRNVRAPVLGSVLNDIDYKRDMRYGGKYGTYGMYSYEYYGMDKA
jgi:tyrosine-protein kinase Etk/Wzc